MTTAQKRSKEAATRSWARAHKLVKFAKESLPDNTNAHAASVARNFLSNNSKWVEVLDNHDEFVNSGDCRQMLIEYGKHANPKSLSTKTATTKGGTPTLGNSQVNHRTKQILEDLQIAVNGTTLESVEAELLQDLKALCDKHTLPTVTVGLGCLNHLQTT